jgi:hypothetical protein
MANRSSEPLAGITTHGVGGYDKGCGCLECRRGNRDRAARHRAAKKAKAEAPVESPKLDQGQFVRKAQAFITELDVQGEEAELLAAMLIFNARLLDHIALTSERWHLAGSAQKTVLELKAQLRRLKDGTGEGKPAPRGDDPKDELAGLLNGLTQQG